LNESIHRYLASLLLFCIFAAVRTVYGTEDGVPALRGVKALKDVRRRYRKGVARLVTRHTASAVRAHGLEKSVIRHIRGTAKIEICESALWVEEGLEAGDELIETLADHQDARTQQKKSSRQA